MVLVGVSDGVSILVGTNEFETGNERWQERQSTESSESHIQNWWEGSSCY